jgi:hypothetical protein
VSSFSLSQYSYFLLGENNMVIIGISGKRGAGKDLFATILAYRGFKNYPFAGALKERVRQDFNLKKEETDGKFKESPTRFVRYNYKQDNGLEVVEGYWTPREIMIAYGQFYRQFDNLFWVKKVFDTLKALPEQSLITISDVRFKNEADYIKEKGGILVRLERDPKLNIYGPNQINDPSETELDDYNGFDFVIPKEHNENPQDLEKAADKLMVALKPRLQSAKSL